MPTVSEYFKLGRHQSSLDFVDVDIDGDLRLFIDPHALRKSPGEWEGECCYLIKDFFQTVLKAIQDGRDSTAKRLLANLREPNETHLGLSKGRARGRALGNQTSLDVWEALRGSEAVKSGLLEELEDAILMIEGISSDIVSDITTNIIRGPLIRYTQEMAHLYGIPLEPHVFPGPLWNPESKKWTTEYNSLPMAKNRRLLLVPKAIVRTRMDYDAGEYYNHYILEYLRGEELSANTELVRLLKDGRRRVTKKDLKGKYGEGKRAVVRETKRNPKLLEQYRNAKEAAISPPLDHIDLDREPEWDDLLDGLRSVPVGNKYAAQYEAAIEKLLSALFYPQLTHPRPQTKLHEGRKRVDITYTNMSGSGFFRWLSLHYPSGTIFVECKNYGNEVANPELDQLSSRFSPSRGQVGILVCRNFKNKALFFKRCRDTATDSRGFVLALDDSDLSLLVKSARRRLASDPFNLLKDQFEKLILNN